MRKNTILRVDDKYIVCIKNEVLNGNKSAVIRNQKEFTEIYHFKARKDIAMMKNRLYTTEQMQQIVDMVVQNLLPQGQKAPENLDNERAQCSLSPYAKLTCSVSEAAKILGISKPTMYDLVHKGTIPSITVGRKILISRAALIDWLENGGTHGKEAC